MWLNCGVPKDLKLMSSKCLKDKDILWHCDLIPCKKFCLKGVFFSLTSFLSNFQTLSIPHAPPSKWDSVVLTQESCLIGRLLVGLLHGDGEWSEVDRKGFRSLSSTLRVELFSASVEWAEGWGVSGEGAKGGVGAAGKEWVADGGKRAEKVTWGGSFTPR